jgi:hypothetical protein
MRFLRVQPEPEPEPELPHPFPMELWIVGIGMAVEAGVLRYKLDVRMLAFGEELTLEGSIVVRLVDT